MFLVHVVDVNRESLNQAHNRCIATVLSDRHFLTAARCLEDISADRILAISASHGIAQTTIHPAVRVSKHPQFVESDLLRNNLAILEIGQSLDTNIFTRQTIGAMQDGDPCFVHTLISPTARGILAVNIRGHANCSSDNNQLFCSGVLHLDSCLRFVPGSPVLCGDEGTINGVTITNCVTNGSNNTLYFHSTGQFSDWIEEVVSEANSLKKLSFLTLFATFLIILKL
ncbi:CLUMA_CG006033, isoform A [Clunio marinus]|uniref:CLUMA_CG006033, isoform A n=1 Tax=Clunio marinus TaxID=568069 RepID=A0A1J1I0W2_9DIPT|nr:CLUMA_CG006033, isoform A [Clunio marinus]